MMYRCPYTQYYTAQAGSGVGKVYRGAAFQRGNGFFGQMFRRFGIPLLKYLGKRALTTGAAVAGDVLAGTKVKDSLKQRAKETGRGILQDAVQKVQSGSGHKRRRLKRKRHSSSKRRVSKKPRGSSDIFG